VAGFFQNLLTDTAKSFFGSDYLRDYTHASKTFRPNAYQNAPKYKFLFHVYFEINQEAFSGADGNFGLVVKSVKLPSFSIATHELNQYNRKRIVQTKIKYDSIDIDFHDDNGNMIRNLWYAYYTYYYKDATKLVNSPGYYERSQYSPSITADTDWGYIGETSTTPSSPAAAAAGQTKVPFFKNIRVYGFNQHNFTQYTFVNPIITRFGHDTYSYADNAGVMENKMSLDYETVTYQVGALNGKTPAEIVTGFGAEANYDTTVSPIARPGSQTNILGQGGLVDGISGFTSDLASGNILGAIQKAGSTYNTFKNVNVVAMTKNEVVGSLYNATQSVPNRNSIFQFPTFGTSSTVNGTAGAPNSGQSAPAKIAGGK
jgi:hypothetical protein